MSAKLKTLVYESIKVHKKLSGKVGATYTSSSGTSSGEEPALLSIMQAMLIHGMIISGNAVGNHYGVAVSGAPKPQYLKNCEEIGKKVAALTKKLVLR